VFHDLNFKKVKNGCERVSEEGLIKSFSKALNKTHEFYLL